MGILSALLPDIHINYIYIYVREQSKQDAHVHGVHNITSKKLNTGTSLNKAPISFNKCGCIQTCDLDHLARLIEFVWIM